MAKLYVSSGRRGRPLSIDPEKELHDLIFDILPKAQKRLGEFRDITSGVRGESILGGQNALPKNLQSTIDILSDLRENESIDYETLREVRANIESARMLASKQERVFGRALEKTLTSEYFESLDYYGWNASDAVKQANERIKAKIRSLSPQQRQKYFLSRQYQDPATMTGQYEKVRAYASKQMGREASMQEAWAYIREQEADAFSNLISMGYKNFTK